MATVGASDFPRADRRGRAGWIKALGRFVGFGVAGSLMLGVGIVLIVLGGLRALQTETDRHLTGHLSWLPYGIALVFCGLVASLAIMRATRKKGTRP